MDRQFVSLMTVPAWRSHVETSEELSEYDRRHLLACNIDKFPVVVLRVLDEHREFVKHIREVKADPTGRTEQRLFMRHLPLLSNGVMSADMGTPLSIERLLVAIPGVTRMPIRFPRLSLITSAFNDKTLFSMPALFIYSTGKVVVSGAPLMEEALYVLQRFALELERIGTTPRLHMAVVVNMVARSHTDAMVNLPRLAQNNQLVTYEPSVFAGAQYPWNLSPASGGDALVRVTVLIFIGGTKVMAGAPTHEHLYKADATAHQLCEEYYLPAHKTIGGGRVYDTSQTGPNTSTITVPVRSAMRKNATNTAGAVSTSASTAKTGGKKRSLQFALGALVIADDDHSTACSDVGKNNDLLAPDNKDAPMTTPSQPTSPRAKRGGKSNAQSAPRRRKSRPKASQKVRAENYQGDY